MAGKPVDAPVPPLEPCWHGSSQAAGLPVPPTGPLPWGDGGSDGGGQQQRRACTWSPGRLLPRVSAAWAEWAALAPRPGRAARGVDGLRGPGGHGHRPRRGAGGLAPPRASGGTPRPTIRPASRRTPPTPAVIHYHQQVDDAGPHPATGVTGHRRGDRQGQPGHRRGVGRTPRPRTPTGAGLARRPVPAGPGPDAEPGSRHPRPAGAPTWTGSSPSSGRLVGTRRRPPGQRPRRPNWWCASTAPAGPADGTEPPAAPSRWPGSGSPARRALVVTGPGGAPTATCRRPAEPLSASHRTGGPGRRGLPGGPRRRPEPPSSLLRPPAGRHPRDFTAGHAPAAGRAAPRPPGPGRAPPGLPGQSTGFYPDHSPRLWEYPVVARLMADDLPPGSRLVDVGAGVTPLAPFLTTRGYVVDTVDPSPTRREWPPQPDWNEWDYLDYGARRLGPPLVELHARPAAAPAAVRRGLLRQRHRARPGRRPGAPCWPTWRSASVPADWWC